LSADPRILLAAARRHFVDLLAVLLEQLVDALAALLLHRLHRRGVLQDTEQL
jgi:hypothetical protein